MSLTLAAVFLLVVFALTWWVCVRVHNYAFVDVVWALSFVPAAVWYAVADGGWVWRRVAVSALVAAWGLRLGVHLLRRVAAHHPHEDGRYAELRKKWSAHLSRNFFLFFVAQGVLVWLLTLPVHLICTRVETAFHPLEYAGLALWAVALVGEAVADAQLARFTRSHQGSKEVCDVGLWHYSRHPNYFFQSLLWWGLFLMALPAPWGWTAIAAPLAMLHFLLNVTGVPLTEKLSLQKRGAAYREYQRTTSAFVPWFRKS